MLVLVILSLYNILNTILLKKLSKSNHFGIDTTENILLYAIA